MIHADFPLSAPRVLPYSTSRELKAALSSVKKDDNTHIIIPSRKDKFFISEPDAWTWNDIYDSIAASSKSRVISPPDHLLILGSILSKAVSENKEKVKALPGIKRAGFLQVLSTDIRELLNEAASPSSLPYDPESSKAAEFLLPVVYSRYVDYLKNNSLLDSAQLCSAALDALKANQSWGKNYVMVFAGFLSFNHSQLELVKALVDRCREVIIIKPEAGMSNFHDAAAQFGIMQKAAPSTGRILQLNITEPDLEPEMTARTLALWSAGEREDLGEFPGFDAVGLMLAEGREEVFAQAFTRYGVPHSFMNGIPISQTLPGRVLSLLENISSRNFPAYETSMLLTQPCFAGAAFPVMKAWRAGRAGLESWREYLAGPEKEDSKIFRDALLAVDAIAKFCGVLDIKNTPEKIMAAFRDFLKTPGLWLERFDNTADTPELDETIRQTASAIETVEHKVLALEELSPDLGSVQDMRFSKEDSYNFLTTWCKNTNTRAAVQTANSVRIFTGQPPVLASFPVWIMTGVTQKTYSGNLQASPLLGSEARAKLQDVHLPTLNEKAEQKEAVFRRLIHTGEELTIISRPLLDDEGRPVAESPFMQRFKEDMAGWKVQVSQTEGIKILLGGDGFIFPEIDAQDKTQRSIPVIEKKAHVVGASDIQELLGCPFLWWQRRQAVIYEPSSDLAAAFEWGNLLHKYWECVWRGYRNDMEASGDVFSLLAAQEWLKLERVSEDYEKFKWVLKDSRLKRKLASIKWRAKRLVKIQAEILDGLHDAGWVHRDILLEEDAHLRADAEGVTFLGQCDRIEILDDADGKRWAFIADYKTGKGENSEQRTNTKNYLWRDEEQGDNGNFAFGLQLSVYAALFKACDLAGVYILGLEDGKVSGTVTGSAQDIFKPHASKKFYGDVTARVLEGYYAMDSAVKILKEGEFSPVYGCEQCQWCKVKSLCRKGEFKGDVIPES